MKSQLPVRRFASALFVPGTRRLSQSAFAMTILLLAVIAVGWYAHLEGLDAVILRDANAPPTLRMFWPLHIERGVVLRVNGHKFATWVVCDRVTSTHAKFAARALHRASAIAPDVALFLPLERSQILAVDLSGLRTPLDVLFVNADQRVDSVLHTDAVPRGKGATVVGYGRYIVLLAGGAATAAGIEKGTPISFSTACEITPRADFSTVGP